jgi:cell division protein FtsB
MVSMCYGRGVCERCEQIRRRIEEQEAVLEARRAEVEALRAEVAGLRALNGAEEKRQARRERNLRLSGKR